MRRRSSGLVAVVSRSPTVRVVQQAGSSQWVDCVNARHDPRDASPGGDSNLIWYQDRVHRPQCALSSLAGPNHRMYQQLTLTSLVVSAALISNTTRLRC